MTRLRGPALTRRLRKIRALVLDVDGVLTDGGMVYGASGEEYKRFNVKDGTGIHLVRRAGVTVAWITGEDSPAMHHRASRLGVVDVYAGITDKRSALESFLEARGFGLPEVAYVADDVADLPVLKCVGLAVAVADAVPDVLRAAHWVTRRRGGEGAVREVCDALLAARA